MTTDSATIVSVVLPCYKDASHLKRNVDLIVQTLALLKLPFEIILVNDASPDETGVVGEEVAAEFGQERVRVLHHEKNQGRGAAFLTGAAAARGDIIGYLDIDLEVAAVYIVECIRRIAREGADLVLGQRHYRIKWGLIHRHILSRTYARLAAGILKLPRGIDSESGYKFFNGDTLRAYLGTFRYQGWFWDTEVVSRFHADGRKIDCVPCLFLRNSDKSSTVAPLRDTLQYSRHLYSYWRERRSPRVTPAPDRRRADLHQTAT